ncbi:MAG: transcription antitermination factor NusB [Clostridia bacterium]|nr:transcription antitermination factor NusB [Clostridia bacterium]
MRTIARESLFKLLFSSQFSSVSEELKRALFKADKLDENDVKYCNEVLCKIKENEQTINEVIDKNSLSFPQSRIYPADKSILYIAIAEILYFNDIPNRVSVNEAANIASKYSSEKSASFISGILSSVIEENDNV